MYNKKMNKKIKNKYKKILFIFYIYNNIYIF